MKDTSWAEVIQDATGRFLVKTPWPWKDWWTTDMQAATIFTSGFNDKFGYAWSEASYIPGATVVRVERQEVPSTEVKWVIPPPPPENPF